MRGREGSLKTDRGGATWRRAMRAMVGGRKGYQGRLSGGGDILVGDLKNRYELMR